jgi:hypothetical protein
MQTVSPLQHTLALPVRFHGEQFQFLAINLHYVSFHGNYELQARNGVEPRLAESRVH